MVFLSTYYYNSLTTVTYISPSSFTDIHILFNECVRYQSTLVSVFVDLIKYDHSLSKWRNNKQTQNKYGVPNATSSDNISAVTDTSYTLVMCSTFGDTVFLDEQQRC